MKRKTFLTLASVIALAVGSFALLAPEALLASKGVLHNPAAGLWLRELGVLLVAVGVLGYRVRAHPDSPTLRAVLLANLLVQLGLLPLELWAWHTGLLTVLSGVVPNSVLHALLASGFAWFYAHCKAVATDAG